MLDDDYYKMMRKQYHNDAWEQKIKKAKTGTYSGLSRTHGREDAEMLEFEKQNQIDEK